MNITETKTKVLKVADLRPNEGQIDGVPANPRYITDFEYQALCKSLEEDNLTGVLQMKVYNWQGEWVVLDGNMRLRALQEMGIEKVQCLIVPDDADTKTLKKIVITSNSTFGQYDMDALANEWSDCPLSDWGCDVPDPEAGLPDELRGLDLNPDELATIVGDEKTEMERIIIVFKKEQAEEVAAFAGLEQIDKVVYRFDELKKDK